MPPFFYIHLLALSLCTAEIGDFRLSDTAIKESTGQKNSCHTHITQAVQIIAIPHTACGNNLPVPSSTDNMGESAVIRTLPSAYTSQSHDDHPLWPGPRLRKKFPGPQKRFSTKIQRKNHAVYLSFLLPDRKLRHILRLDLAFAT